MKEKNNLTSALDIHWRTEPDGKEYVLRMVATKYKDITAMHRQLVLTKGWRKRLDDMRAAHRAAGIPDKQFQPWKNK